MCTAQRAGRFDEELIQQAEATIGSGGRGIEWRPRTARFFIHLGAIQRFLIG
jgi:hypothetical protein